MSKLTLSLLAVLVSAAAAASPRAVSVQSPDGRTEASVSDTPDGLALTVSHDGQTLLLPSPIGITLESAGTPLAIRSARQRHNIHEHIEAPLYRQREFDFAHNRADIDLGHGVRLALLAADEGVAYRFETTRKGPQKVLGETAAYTFAPGAEVCMAHSTNRDNPLAMAFQNTYTVTPIVQADPLPAFLPVTVTPSGDQTRLTVLESDLLDYPGMWVSADSAAGTLNAVFANVPSEYGRYPWRDQTYVTATCGHIADLSGPAATPWRVLAITDDDTQMPVNNMVYALASPSRVADTSWITPGKVAWDWWNDWTLDGVPFEAGINNDTYRHYIDFASAHGIEYVVLDEGWYVPSSGDMLTVIDDIDLPSLVEYGRGRNVGIVLWTVFNVLDSQLEEACRRYADMGVKGFKVDFLDRDDQQAVQMAVRIADTCARHRMMLDYHGYFKPSGLSRTYPNVVNYEAVFGMEEMKWSDPSVDMPLYDVTFPFVRMMCGPVDYTPGAMRNSTRAEWRAVYSHPESQGTRCHQLAAYIVQDSPLTMLADSPSAYRGEDECVEFIAGLPTVFDNTRILDGKMGSHIVTLRQKGDSYYAGGMTSWQARPCTLDCSFLPEGAAYTATVMADGPNAAKTARDYRREVLTVDSHSRLQLDMAPGGGFAVRFDKK